MDLFVEKRARIPLGRGGLRLARARGNDGAAWHTGIAVFAQVAAVGGHVRIGQTAFSVDMTATFVREPQATYRSSPHPPAPCDLRRPSDGDETIAAPPTRSGPLLEIVALTPVMADVVATLRKVAVGDTTILLMGESGTGKEVAARAIQANGPRAGRPFITVNAAALSEGLLESELFGHERGAFTGAIARRSGVFELAHGGTLFLDEIGEISSSMQAKLLRVLETGEIRRVGGNETRKFDVRLITATNRRLRARVRDGSFREDLYYRLAVVEVHLPPLRERGADFVPICAQLLRALAADRGISMPTIDAEALDRLRAYRFPGNIRELRNVLERGLLLGDGRRIREVDLPPEIRAANAKRGEEATLLPLAEVERRHIAAALRLTGWNKKRAAEILRVDRKTLYAKIAAFALRPDDVGEAASAAPRVAEDLPAA